jgi:hypothetical protein
VSFSEVGKPGAAQPYGLRDTGGPIDLPGKIVTGRQNEYTIPAGVTSKAGESAIPGRFDGSI